MAGRVWSELAGRGGRRDDAAGRDGGLSRAVSRSRRSRDPDACAVGRARLDGVSVSLPGGHGPAAGRRPCAAARAAVSTTGRQSGQLDRVPQTARGRTDGRLARASPRGDLANHGRGGTLGVLRGDRSPAGGPRGDDGGGRVPSGRRRRGARPVVGPDRRGPAGVSAWARWAGRETAI